MTCLSKIELGTIRYHGWRVLIHSCQQAFLHHLLQNILHEYGVCRKIRLSIFFDNLMRCPVILPIDDQFGQCRPFAIIVEYGYLIFVGQTYQVPQPLNNAQVYQVPFPTGIVTHVMKMKAACFYRAQRKPCRYLYTSKHVFFPLLWRSQYHILRVWHPVLLSRYPSACWQWSQYLVQHFCYCIGHDFVFFHLLNKHSARHWSIQRNVYSGVTIAGRECHGRCWRQYGFFHQSVIIRTGSESRQVKEKYPRPHWYKVRFMFIIFIF